MEIPSTIPRLLLCLRDPYLEPCPILQNCIICIGLGDLLKQVVLFCRTLPMSHWVTHVFHSILTGDHQPSRYSSSRKNRGDVSDIGQEKQQRSWPLPSAAHSLALFHSGAGYRCEHHRQIHEFGVFSLFFFPLSSRW